jgi:hypothetical protein
MCNEEGVSSGLILIAEGEEERTPAALVERTNSQAVDPATVVVIEVGGPLALNPRLTGFVPCLTDDGVLVRQEVQIAQVALGAWAGCKNEWAESMSISWLDKRFGRRVAECGRSTDGRDESGGRSGRSRRLRRQRDIRSL